MAAASPALALEAGAEHRVAGDVGRDHLERHRPTEGEVGRAEDQPHAALADEGVDSMPGEIRAERPGSARRGTDRVRAGRLGRHPRQPGAEARIEIGAAREHRAHRLDQLRLGRVLEDVTAGARAQRRAREARFRLHRQHHDRASRGRLEEPGNRRQRRRARHVQIEHHDPRLMSFGERQGRLDIACFSHHGEVCLAVEHAAKPAADQRVIVGEHDPDRIRKPRQRQ